MYLPHPGHWKMKKYKGKGKGKGMECSPVRESRMKRTGMEP